MCEINENMVSKLSQFIVPDFNPIHTGGVHNVQRAFLFTRHFYSFQSAGLKFYDF